MPNVRVFQLARDLSLSSHDLRDRITSYNVCYTKLLRVQPIKKQALKLQILIISAITLLFFLAAPLIARILGDLSLTNLFRLSTLIIPAFASASFYFYYYTGIHHFNLQSILV